MALQKAVLLNHLQQIYLFSWVASSWLCILPSSINLVRVGLKCWDIDVVVVTREKCSHDTVGALDDWAYTDTSPLGNIFRRRCIAIMASTIEKNSKLDCNWQLHISQSPRLGPDEGLKMGWSLISSRISSKISGLQWSFLQKRCGQWMAKWSRSWICGAHIGSSSGARRTQASRASG